MSDLHFHSFTGQAVEAVFEPLARLRIAVFRDFPYLYEGTLAYEMAYLRTYSSAERSFLFAVYHEEHMVGATTCIPLQNETEEVQAPFLATGYDLKKIFYFGESILLPAYRGLGLGNRFFDERERHAASFHQYEITCFCAVDRPADHPLRPAGYQPLDAFWQKRGYHKEPQLQTQFSWPDIGETTSTPKTMTYWLR